MTTTQFKTLRLIGDRPVPDSFVVMNAPRPLFGDPLHIDRMGFTVTIAPDVYGRAGFVDENYRLDATVLQWVTEAAALAEITAHAVADYGQDAVDGCCVDELLDMWRMQFRTGTVEVES